MSKDDCETLLRNDNKLFDFSLGGKFHWSTKSLGKFNDINTITVIVNNKLKNHIELNDSNRKLFK